MKIRTIGPRNHLGVGVHYTNFVDRLRQVRGIGDMVEEVDSTNQQDLLAAAGRSQPNDINICFVSIDLQPWYRGTNIQWIVFESTKVPDIILSTMLAADLVWTPSRWGRDILISSGVDEKKLDIVPEGVDATVYHPYHGKHRREVMRFLSVGKFERRKSHIETMLAWSAAFGNDPAVELVIKTDHFIKSEEKQQFLQDFLNKHSMQNVKIVWGSCDQHQMLELYQTSDVFVLPTKGEGWGLPIIEAAAMGLPIVCTNYSAHTEYLQHMLGSVGQVEYDLQPIDCEEFQYFYPSNSRNQGSWAVPRIQSISQNLTIMRKNIKELQQRAWHNANVVRQRFDWNQSVESALRVLHNRALLTA